MQPNEQSGPCLPYGQTRPYEKNESVEQSITVKDHITILSEIPKIPEASEEYEGYEEMIRDVRRMLLSLLPDALRSGQQPGHSSGEKQSNSTGEVSP